MRSKIFESVANYFFNTFPPRIVLPEVAPLLPEEMSRRSFIYVGEAILDGLSAVFLLTLSLNISMLRMPMRTTKPRLTVRKTA